MLITQFLLNLKRLVVAALFAHLSLTVVNANETDEKPWLDEPINAADARHLLSRTGFDAAPEAQLSIAELTRREAIDWVMDGFRKKPQRPMPAWTTDTAPLYWARRDLNEEQRRGFDRLRDREISQLRNWWVDEMLTTTSPQTERMVLFWHDHFATSYRGINRQSMAMARQNQTFRELGMGDMASLLTAMIRDPALLRYLNNINNKRQSPNENLARELMELFTLGEGNYDEATVREAARALTGYSVSPNQNLKPRFNFWQHDEQDKTLFGETGPFNGDDLVALLLKQPALDRFIASRFWHWLVADRTPTNDEIQPLAQAFRASGHRLDALYRQTLESENFWHADNRGAIIKSPATLLIGTARTLDTPKRISHRLPRLMKLAGQDLLAPPNVSGWKEGSAWITPGRLLNRYSALEAILKASRKGGATDDSTTDADAMMATDSMTENAMDANADNAMALSEGSADEDQTMGGDDKAERALTLRLASEEYEGPVQYRLELLNERSDVLWSSGERVLSGGWDTSRYGPINSRDQLPWQNITVPIPSALLSNSDKLRVHFVNDAADGGGDRNLYVDTLGTQGSWANPVLGSQASTCTPANGADAGDLYCNGYVDFNLEELQPSNTDAPVFANQMDVVHYASKHVHWARHNRRNGDIHAHIVFQDVRFGERHWPIFTAQYRLPPGNNPELWLHNQECWPDCIEQWPDCAWIDDRDPIGRTLRISAIPAPASDERACHIAGLQDDEAQLVDGLLMQSVAILGDVLARENAQSPNQRMNIKNGLSAMLERMQQDDVVESFNTTSPTQRTAIADVPTWVQHDAAQRPYPQETTPEALPVVAASLAAREKQITASGFNWATTLAPGIDVSELPGWDDASVNDNDSNTYERVRRWLLNPAYQVY